MTKAVNRIIFLFKIIIIVFALIGAFFTFVFFGIKYGFLNVSGTIDERNNSILGNKEEYVWIQTEEWKVLSTAFLKDSDTLNRVSKETGVPVRMIVAVAMPEQFRFFTSNRDSYKKFFEPLKILGTMSQFSLGVTGIKPETAKQIEIHLKDSSSSFFLGEKYANLLDYVGGGDKDAVLYARLTDQHNHYYQYLYSALFIKQVEAQWKRSGIDISAKPGIVATLFNLGFNKSLPNPNADIGGALIPIGDTNISFGRLGQEFYFSGELLSQFPY